MTYFSVLSVTPTSDDWVANYIASVGDIVSRHGGEYLARTASHEQLEGDAEMAALRIIIKWLSRADALNFMQDPDYAPHLAARTKGSTSIHHLIEAKDDLA
ncbi:MAG: DUF1330 domain-containing protein [Pseudomonadota bacterium]